MEDLFPINKQINASQVRIVGEEVGQGIYDLEEALHIAKEKELDLVQISDKGEMPICKVVDFPSFMFHKKKAERAKKKAQKTSLKHIRLRPNTDAHDMEVKKRQAIGFLEKGASVEVSVLFRRREYYVAQEHTKVLLTKLMNELEAFGGRIKQPVKLVNRKMFTIIDPTTSKGKH